MSAELVGSHGSGPRRAPIVRLVAARVLGALGWPGVIGMALLAVAAIWLGSGWEGRRELERSDVQGAATPVRLPIEERPGEPPARLKLPRHGDIQSLLARIAQAARSQDLGWPAADYRVNPATAERLATLDVRCTLKGPYPKLRRFLAQVLSKVPGATIRELQMSRPSSETLDVEAKLVLQVFLDEETADIGGAAAKGATP